MRSTQWLAKPRSRPTPIRVPALAARLLPLVLLTLQSEAAPGRIYLTEFGRRILARTDEIVEARVGRIQRAFRGITTARLDIQERLSGFEQGSTLLLMYVDDLMAPDAFGATLDRTTVSRARSPEGDGGTNPDYRSDLRGGGEVAAQRTVHRARDQARPAGSTPGEGAGVRLAEGQEGLFFLERKGASFTLVGLVPRSDPLYDSKRERLEELLRIEAVAAWDLRVRHARRVYVESLGAENPWERGNAARELVFLARRFPDAFGVEDVRTIAEALRTEREPPIRASLERTLRSIHPTAALDFARQAEEEERREWAQAIEQERRRLDTILDPDVRAADLHRAGLRFGRAATGLICLYLADESGLVRERAAQLLAEQGGPSCRPVLRDALREEKDASVAAALIYACGVKSDPEAVAVVGARLRDPILERVAIRALARIGTADARRALVDHRTRTDDGTRDFIDALLREEFEEAG